MPKVTTEMFSDWSGGVISALQADALPPNAVPRGWNSAFYKVGPSQVSAIGTRRGAGVLNTTAVTGTPAILENFQYKRLTGGSYALYHLLVSDGGRFDALDTSTFTAAAADGSAATPFTAGTHFPDYEIANNLAFIVNGVDAKKFNGTNVQNFGLVAPAAPTLSTVATGQTATDDVAITYYNSVTGLESSRSPFTTLTLANQKMKVDWVASADAQVTDVRVYYRRPLLGTTFVLASTVPIGATTVTLNLSDSDINALITPAPDTAANNPPPSGIKYLTWHYSRMFAADDTTVYYSQLGQPEAFDPDFAIPVNKNDGQKITALHSAQEVLFIFKERSIYVLVGADPESWTLRLLVPDLGAVSHRSIVTVEGITYWWSAQGPAQLAGLGTPKLIGTPFLDADIGPLTISQSHPTYICAAVDHDNQRIVWAVPGVNQSRNTFLLPFHYRVQRWESNKWDPMDVCSMGSVEDTSGRTWVHLGNYKGRIFRLWNSDTDGARTNDGAGTNFTLASTLLGSHFTSSVMTDAGATFDTTGNGLAELYMFVLNSTDPTDVQRLRIASNTSTAITLDTSEGAAFINIQPTVTYNYYIAGPDFHLDSPWNDAQAWWIKKRYEFLYISFIGLDATVLVDIDLAFTNAPVSRTVSTTFVGSGTLPLWNIAVWDSSVWAGATTTDRRIRVGATGQNWQTTVRHRMPNEPLVLVALGMRSIMLNDKTG